MKANFSFPLALCRCTVHTISCHLPACTGWNSKAFIWPWLRGPIAHRAPLGICNGTCGDAALRCWRKRTRRLPQTLWAVQRGLALEIGILHPPVLPGLDRYIYIYIYNLWIYPQLTINGYMVAIQTTNQN